MGTAAICTAARTRTTGALSTAAAGPVSQFARTSACRLPTGSTPVRATSRSPSADPIRPYPASGGRTTRSAAIRDYPSQRATTRPTGARTRPTTRERPCTPVPDTSIWPATVGAAIGCHMNAESHQTNRRGCGAR